MENEGERERAREEDKQVDEVQSARWARVRFLGHSRQQHFVQIQSG